MIYRFLSPVSPAQAGGFFAALSRLSYEEVRESSRSRHPGEGSKNASEPCRVYRFLFPVTPAQPGGFLLAALLSSYCNGKASRPAFVRYAVRAANKMRQRRFEAYLWHQRSSILLVDAVPPCSRAPVANVPVRRSTIGRPKHPPLSGSTVIPGQSLMGETSPC